MTDHRAKVQECLEEALACRTAEFRLTFLRLSLVWDALASDSEDEMEKHQVPRWRGGSTFWSSANPVARAALERIGHRGA